MAKLKLITDDLKSSHLNVVEELEAAGLAGSLAHSLGQLQRASASLGPVVARHGGRGPALSGEPTHEVDLRLGVGPGRSPGGKHCQGASAEKQTT